VLDGQPLVWAITGILDTEANSPATYVPPTFDLPLPPALPGWDLPGGLAGDPDDLGSAGGLIEFHASSDSFDSAAFGEPTEAAPWKIEQSTVDRLQSREFHSLGFEETEPAAASEALADASSSEDPPPSEEEGGLIEFVAAALPKTPSGPGIGETVIDLDSNMGHFRSFDIAATPGHDVIPTADAEMTLTSIKLPSDVGPDEQSGQTPSVIVPPLDETRLVVASKSSFSGEPHRRGTGDTGVSDALDRRQLFRIFDVAAASREQVVRSEDIDVTVDLTSSSANLTQDEQATEVSSEISPLNYTSCIIVGAIMLSAEAYSQRQRRPEKLRKLEDR
ncbi:MAG: hypothetical protein MI861_09060, partial [Pirellulales bacterium]|nr:hypothetical protein [Pirellulales bacterium]